MADEAQAIEEEEKRNNELIKRVQVGETEYYTLNFDIRHYGALSPDSGTVTLNPAGLTHPFGEEVAYPAGTEVTITANPAPGYYFHSFGCWACGDTWYDHPWRIANPTTITLDTHKHISVNFNKDLQIRPDVNGDGRVNVLDMVLIGQKWGQSGSPGWIREDVNRDGKIDELDMIIVGQHWTG